MSADALNKVSANGAIDRLKTNCRSTFDILSLNVHLSKEVFFYFLIFLKFVLFFLSQMQVYFPLNTIFFCVTNLTAFGHFTKSEASDEFLLSVIIIKKLRFNRP